MCHLTLRRTPPDAETYGASGCANEKTRRTKTGTEDIENKTGKYTIFKPELVKFISTDDVLISTKTKRKRIKIFVQSLAHKLY